MKKIFLALSIIPLISYTFASELKNNSTNSIAEVQSVRNTTQSKDEILQALKEIGWYESKRNNHSVTFTNANYIEVMSFKNRTVKSWTKVINDPEPLNLSAKSFFEYNELHDCINNTVTLLEAKEFKNTILISTKSFKDVPKLSIPPDSLANGVHSDICEYLDLIK